MYFKLNILWGLPLLVLTSCDKPFIELEKSKDPVANFKFFWQEMDEYYALFEFKEVDWQQEYQEHQPLLLANPTNDQLWESCTQMIAKLDDNHTFILDIDQNRAFISGEAARAHAIREYSITLIREKYLDPPYQRGRDTAITYGYLKETNLGYIHFANMQGDYPEELQSIGAYFKDTDGLIVDIRNNDGGSDEYSQTAAGAFSDGEHFIYSVQTKNGPEHTQFDEPNNWFTEFPEGFTYLKPIILITDRRTVSAGEIFCFNMKAFSHVYHIGDNTSGALSDLSPIRTLPNGWIYGFSYQKYLTPQGESLEGIGIAPDFYIRNEEADILNGIDKVLEYAIDYLE